ncbi:maleylacetate reductase [Kribbella yunnanensis]|uniref:Maleylacetate reductase n=1 Tax=Kribbella yunnanensis TaxID=190194 RepID=A0ABN2GY90_9ACTN
MTDSFVHTSYASRVVFGPGTLEQVAAEVELLGVRRALVIATGSAQQAADVVEEALTERFAGRIDGVRQHVPTEVAEAARATAREVEADGIVAIGGGSAIGLAKAIALTADVKILAVPTTYAGSEMTPVWGETSGGSKTTGTDVRVLPKTVVYDPMLTLQLPLHTTAASVANALAHCVEAVWTERANPITETAAVEAAKALADGFRELLREPEPRSQHGLTSPADLSARGELLFGACLAGSALASAGTGVHHKLCHLLGGTYNLPHAETHAAVLPQVARVKAAEVPRAKARLEEALQTDDLATGLFDLFKAANIPTSLQALGLTREQAAEAADRFPGDVEEILTRAWAGTRPEGAER